MRRWVVVLLGLVACQAAWAQKKSITDGNGESWVLIECSSAAWCFKRASEACPAGYTERTGMPPDGRAMMIRCRDTQAKSYDWNNEVRR